MEMTRETSMLPVLSKHEFMFGSGLSKAYELSSGFGIADMVFYKLDNKVSNDRYKQNLKPILSYDLIRILTTLNQIHCKTINLTLLEKAIPSLKSKGEIITYLLENQYLLRNNGSNKEFIKGREYKIGLREVVAIEAKLSDWQRGLYQAYRYRQFANKSYLALYSKYLHRALKNIDYFKRFNIGLIEVSSDSILIHYDPKKESMKSNVYSALVYERLLDAKGKHFPKLLKKNFHFLHLKERLHY